MLFGRLVAPWRASAGYPVALLAAVVLGGLPAAAAGQSDGRPTVPLAQFNVPGAPDPPAPEAPEVIVRGDNGRVVRPRHPLAHAARHRRRARRAGLRRA